MNGPFNIRMRQGPWITGGRYFNEIIPVHLGWLNTPQLENITTPSEKGREISMYESFSLVILQQVFPYFFNAISSVTM